MCADYGNKIGYRDYVDVFREVGIELRFPPAIPNLEPREDIRPTDVAPIIRTGAEGPEFVQLRWGFPPFKPKGPPVINFRSEGRRFERGRCLIPASHFFEFTGDKYPKTKWRFTKTDEEWFCFAGLWRTGELPTGPVEAFTLLTCEPGPDMQPFHNREPVILDRRDWSAWLDLTRPEAELLKPRAAGSLVVEKVER